MADDCEFNLEAIQHQLESLDMQADIVKDGEQACEAVRNRLNEG